MAVKRSNLADRVFVWARRPEVLEACREEDWCDGIYADVAESVEKADLVVVCAPVHVIPDLVRRIAGHLSDGCLVTDVGSTKVSICEACESVAGAAHFIGSHPMAGSEKSGLEHAEADLFEGRPCIVTPHGFSPSVAVDRLQSFWEALGMQVFRMSPNEHDRILAHISHLPHLLASTLSAQLESLPHEWTELAGNGLRDTTRIAAGSPIIWRSIFQNNSAELLRAIDGFEDQLSAIREMAAKGDFVAVQAFLEDGQRYRNRL